MILLWRISYFDKADRTPKHRDLWLDTAQLDPVTRAAVEATNELKQPGGGRAMLKYRHLFKPEPTPGEMVSRLDQAGEMGSVFIHDYYEDEQGNPLTSEGLAEAITGSKTSV